ncbi:MAG: hypothetical protein WC648_05060 [Candidatus Paceibacterota bacterium]|jgi:hypothetical protein
MRKILILIGLIITCSGFDLSAEPSSIPGAYQITLNTTTFVAITIARKICFYNPGSYDIKLATTSTPSAANRFTIKAATYINPIEVNAILYAIATDTNSLTLEAFTAK